MKDLIRIECHDGLYSLWVGFKRVADSATLKEIQRILDELEDSDV